MAISPAICGRCGSWRLGHAAAMLGANRVRTITHITIPPLKVGLVSFFLLAFAPSFDELTVAIFVAEGINRTLSRQMCDDLLLQSTLMIAAATVMIFVVATALLSLSGKLRQPHDI